MHRRSGNEKTKDEQAAPVGIHLSADVSVSFSTSKTFPPFTCGKKNTSARRGRRRSRSARGTPSYCLLFLLLVQVLEELTL